MFPFSSIAEASSSPTTTSGVGASVAGFVPLILIFCVFYFLVVRPQQKKLKEHNRLLDSIKKGDRVVAAGGLIGTVNKVDSNAGHLHVEVANGVELRILKSSVSEVLNAKSSTDKQSNNASSSAKKDNTTR